MNKLWIIIILIFLVIPFFLFAQMDEIIINSPVFKSKSRSSVKFNHANHMTIEGVSCTDCHHRFENHKNVLDPGELTDENKNIFCSNCHGDATKLKGAYHRLCIKCHQSMVKQKKAAAPRLCGECHK